MTAASASVECCDMYFVNIPKTPTLGRHSDKLMSIIIHCVMEQIKAIRPAHGTCTLYFLVTVIIPQV